MFRALPPAESRSPSSRGMREGQFWQQIKGIYRQELKGRAIFAEFEGDDVSDEVIVEPGVRLHIRLTLKRLTVRLNENMIVRG